MWKPSAYDWVYPLSYMFTFSIATPHSILIQLAYPAGNLAQGESTCPESMLRICNASKSYIGQRVSCTMN